MSIRVNKSLKRPSIFQTHSASLTQPSIGSFAPDMTSQSQRSNRLKSVATTMVSSTVKRFKLRRGRTDVSPLEVIVPATLAAADLPVSCLTRRRRPRRSSLAVDIPAVLISSPRPSQLISPPERSIPCLSEPPNPVEYTLSPRDASRTGRVLATAHGDDCHASLSSALQTPARDLRPRSIPLPLRPSTSYILAPHHQPSSPTISEWRDSTLRLVTQPLRDESVPRTTQSTLLLDSRTPRTPALLPSNTFAVGSGPSSNETTPGDEFDSSFEQYFRNSIHDERPRTPLSDFGGHFLREYTRAYSPSIVHSARVRSEQGHDVLDGEVDSTESVYNTTRRDELGPALSVLLLPLPLSDGPSRTSSGARIRTKPVEGGGGGGGGGVNAERNTFGQTHAESIAHNVSGNNMFGVLADADDEDTEGSVSEHSVGVFTPQAVRVRTTRHSVADFIHGPEGSDGLHDPDSDIGREGGFRADEPVVEEPGIVACKDSFPLGQTNLVNGPAVMEEVQEPEYVAHFSEDSGSALRSMAVSMDASQDPPTQGYASHPHGSYASPPFLFAPIPKTPPPRYVAETPTHSAPLSHKPCYAARHSETPSRTAVSCPSSPPTDSRRRPIRSNTDFREGQLRARLGIFEPSERMAWRHAGVWDTESTVFTKSTATFEQDPSIHDRRTEEHSSGSHGGHRRETSITDSISSSASQYSDASTVWRSTTGHSVSTDVTIPQSDDECEPRRVNERWPEFQAV